MASSQGHPSTAYRYDGGGGHPIAKAHVILAAQLLPQLMAALRH
jgi:hypothetical protein